MSERDGATSDAGAESSVGRSVGRYDILEEIGRGGMGVVHLARQRDLDRLVALKVLHAFHASTAGFAERFVRESRVAASLSHPNIVTVYEFFEDDSTPYIAMEYVPRGSLRLWVGHLSLAQLAGVLEDLLAGLAAVEPSGIVHRDLKPENVMVTGDGRVKIADFGIAKADDWALGDRLTAGEIVGTPAYMAPEQALCEEVGPWTDLYSVGIMAYEHLVGRVPFHDSSAPMAILLRHVREQVPPVIDSRPTVDPALSDWVSRLLVKDPHARTRRPSEAWEDLEEIIIGLLGPRWRLKARLSGERPAANQLESIAAQSFHSQRISVPIIGAPLAGVDRPGADGGRVAPVQRVRTPARTRPAWWAGLLLLIIAVALLAGFAISHRSDHGESLNGKASDRTLEVTLPASWRKASSSLTASALKLGEPIVLKPPYPNSTLVLADTSTASPTLLPASYLATLPSVPSGEVVVLGGRDMYRYRDIKPSGARTFEAAYALPTTDGVIFGLCVLPSSYANAVAADCEVVLGSLKLLRAKALALGPSPAYASALAAALKHLNAVRTRAATELAQAKSSGAQSDDAKTLAGAYDHAVSALRDATPGPAEQSVGRSIVAALSSVARGYLNLAKAAHSENAKAFGEASRVVTSATSGLASLLEELTEFGYKLAR